MKRIFLFLITMILLIPLANAPSVSNTTHQSSIIVRPPPSPVPITNVLSMKMLSSNISGCSQVFNVNSTWIGSNTTSLYQVSPSSFSLISKTPNVIYGNNTDIATPNEQNTWYLFNRVSVTLMVSFEFCSNSDTLTYSDGSFNFILF